MGGGPCRRGDPLEASAGTQTRFTRGYRRQASRNEITFNFETKYLIEFVKKRNALRDSEFVIYVARAR